MNKYLLLFFAFLAFVVLTIPVTKFSKADTSQQDDWSLEAVGTLHKNGVRHVDAREALTVIQNIPDIVVIDVRTHGEFAESHIDGAINIDYYGSDFQNNVRKLDPTKVYLVHCKTGVRSGRSVPIMLKAGIANIVHMDGGFDAWKSAGLPRVSGN